MDIEFKVKDMKPGSDGESFMVVIEYREAKAERWNTQSFSFLNTDLKNEAWLDKIKKDFENQFQDDISKVINQYTGKSMIYKVKSTKKG